MSEERLDSPSRAASTEALGAFVSYSRHDSAFVRRLVAVLQGRGIEVWRDEDDIPPAARWREELTSAIEGAGAFVAVISPESVASPECRRELDHALSLGKRIVPVLRADAAGVAEELSSRQYVRMREGDDEDAAVDVLVAAISTDLDWVRGHTRWLEEALRWEAAERDRGLLLRGSDLPAAEAWLSGQAARAEPRPTEAQVTFIQASRRGSTRRLQTIVGAAAVAVVVAAGLAAFALIQRGEAIDQRDLARSRELAALSATERAADSPLTALTHAVEARDLRATPEAAEAVRDAMATPAVAVLRSAGQITAVAALPDGRVVSGSADGLLRIWDLAAGGEARVIGDLDDAVLSLAVFPDGRIVSGGFDRTVRVWAPDGGGTIVGRHDDGVGAIAVLPDGRIVSGGDDGTVRVWEPSAGAQGRILGRHEQEPPAVFDVAVLPDGLIVSGGADGTVRTWDPAGDGEGRVVADTQGVFDVVHDVAALADGRILSGSDDGTARIWDPAGGGEGQLVGRHADSVDAVAILADGLIATGGRTDATVRIWDPEGGGGRRVLGRQEGGVAVMTALPDGRIVSGGVDGTLRVWDPAIGGHGRLAGRQPAPLTEVAVLPDGRIASADVDGGVWVESQNREGVKVGEAGGLVTAFASLPDGRIAGAGGGSLWVWDADDPDAVQRFDDDDADAGGIAHLSVTSDGQLTSTAVDGTVRAWDLAAGEGRVIGGHGDLGNAVTLSDGRVAGYSGADGYVRVADGPDQEPRMIGRSAVDVYEVLALPDGGFVTGGQDGAVRFWDPDGTDESRIVARHADAVVALTLDGQGQLMSGGRDGTVRLWNPSEGGEAGVIGRQAADVQALAATPDGKVVAGGFDGGVRVWECVLCRPFPDVLDAARARIPAQPLPDNP